MTVNLFCVTKNFAVCVADRRLTYASGPLASDRAKKILHIQCQDARLIAAFNGFAGSSEGDTPIDLIFRAESLGNMGFWDLTSKIKSKLENRLKNTPRNNAKLSFTLIGFWQGRPVLVHISNYEFLKPKQVLNDAQQTMKIELFTDDFIAVQTGFVCKPKKEAALSKKFKEFYERGATPECIRKTMLKAARDIPYLGERDGVVGANCHSVILSATGESRSMLHAIGGTTVYEFPDIIGPRLSYSDIMVDTSPSKDGPAWGHPETRNTAKLKDRFCRKCRNPVPPGQNQCGVCDAKTVNK